MWMKALLLIICSYASRIPYLPVTVTVLFVNLLSCSTIPLHKFSDNPYLPEIDYRDSSSWFTLSNMPKNLPEELKRLAKADPILYKALHSEGVKADVFFIHPTSFFLSNSWNQNPLNSLYVSEISAIYEFLWKSFQVSVFSECCKIFAPRYRQITYGAFSDNESGLLARDLAFSDILKAFDYYMENYNKGNPIIIGGHSQGSELALRLIYERFHNSNLKNKLVVAYIPGFPFAIEDLSRRISSVPICSSRLQTSCITSWLTLSEKVDLKKIQEEGERSTLRYNLGEWLPLSGKELVCVNPISWRQNTERIPKLNNPGTYIPIIPEFMSFPILHETTTKIIKGFASAQCKNGLLLTDAPQSQLVVSDADYHRYDIPLYYLSIKENVQERLASYYNTKQSE